MASAQVTVKTTGTASACGTASASATAVSRLGLKLSSCLSRAKVAMGCLFLASATAGWHSLPAPYLAWPVCLTLHLRYSTVTCCEDSWDGCLLIAGCGGCGSGCCTVHCIGIVRDDLPLCGALMLAFAAMRPFRYCLGTQLCMLPAHPPAHYQWQPTLET